MDLEDRIVSEVAIRDGRFAQVVDAGPLGPCARVVDLGGRVPEDRIPKIRSALTLQGGRVVHAN